LSREKAFRGGEEITGGRLLKTGGRKRLLGGESEQLGFPYFHPGVAIGSLVSKREKKGKRSRGASS